MDFFLLGHFFLRFYIFCCFFSRLFRDFSYTKTGGGQLVARGPQRFQWPAEAIRRNLQILKFLQLTVNVSADANVNRDLLLFPLKGSPPSLSGCRAKLTAHPCNKSVTISFLFECLPAESIPVSRLK